MSEENVDVATEVTEPAEQTEPKHAASLSDLATDVNKDVVDAVQAEVKADAPAVEAEVKADAATAEVKAETLVEKVVDEVKHEAGKLAAEVRKVARQVGLQR